MRPVKFRAWDKVSKQIRVVNAIGWKSDSVILADEDGNSVTRDSGQCTLAQYTGIEDVTGREVYEGDILKHDRYDKARRWVVEYRKDSEYVGFVKVCRRDHEAGLVSTFMSWEGCEVIGNIYENPELLEPAP